MTSHTHSVRAQVHWNFLAYRNAHTYCTLCTARIRQRLVRRRFRELSKAARMNVTAASLFTNKRKRGVGRYFKTYAHTSPTLICSGWAVGWLEQTVPVLTDIELTHISLRLLPHNVMQISCLKRAVWMSKNSILDIMISIFWRTVKGRGSRSLGVYIII